MNNDNGSGAPMLVGNWVVVLLGARTLLGRLRGDDIPDPNSPLFNKLRLEPVYQIEVRAVPALDPNTKQPTMVRQRHISAPAELTGWDSLELPDAGVVIKSVSELLIPYQREMAQLVANYEAAVSAAQRKMRIDQEAAEAARATSFGGGARKDD